MNRKIKTAIIGVGSMSYYDTLKQFSIIDIAGVWDYTPDHFAAAAKDAGVNFFSSFEDILKDPKIELVVNAMEPKCTYEYSKELMEHGKHVYVGKLIATSFEKGQDLCRLSKEKGVMFGCGPDCFMNGGMQTARRLIDQNVIGTIRSGNVVLNRNSRLFGEFITYLNEKDGGILHDVGAYYILPLMEMLGPVAEVAAFGKKSEEMHKNTRLGGLLYGTESPVLDHNVIAANLKFSNGVLVSLSYNGATAILQDYDFSLHGDQGIIGMGHPHDYDIPITLQTKLHGPIPVPFSHGFIKNVHFGIAAAEMAWALVGNRAPRHTPETALHLLEVIKGIEKSSLEGGKIVKIRTTMERQKPLPVGYIGNLPWEPGEEGALV